MVMKITCIPYSLNAVCICLPQMHEQHCQPIVMHADTHCLTVGAYSYQCQIHMFPMFSALTGLVAGAGSQFTHTLRVNRVFACLLSS